MTEKILKDRFHISADELESRMEKQSKFHDEPIQKATMVLEKAIEKVVVKLGVDVTKDPESIRLQQKLLGIEMNTLEGYPGIFVSVIGNNGPTVYAWISDAILKNDRKYHYEIQWFTKGNLDEIGEVKIS